MILLTHPNVLAAGGLFRAMVPIVPSTSLDLKQVSVLIAAGKPDAIANSQETPRLVQILEAAGGAVNMFWHNGGHEFGQDDLGRCNELGIGMARQAVSAAR